MSQQLSLFEPPPPEYNRLSAVQSDCLACTACRLSQRRNRVVFGAGNPKARLMLVGQGPSQSDNDTGLPYTGPSGDVLDKALAEVGLNRQDIWLTNIHKCLSFDHKNDKLRTPRADELSACEPWLRHEIRLVKPKVIVCIGGPAAKHLIGPKFNLNQQRGQWFTSHIDQIKTLATYQPAYLMRLKSWDRPQALASWKALIADLFTALQAL